MPKLSQVSFANGEVSPSVGERTDLARFATSLGLCSNFFVHATGGVSNRPGTEFVQALSTTSLSTLLAFEFSISQSYVLALQEAIGYVVSNGALVLSATTAIINNVAVAVLVPGVITVTYTTVAPHAFPNGSIVSVSGVVSSFVDDVNIVGTAAVGSPTTFTFILNGSGGGSYVSGGVATLTASFSHTYQSADLASLRYTQSADVMTIANQNYPPSEFVRTSATSFAFAPITDFLDGPFRDDNDDETITVKSSAATGVVTLTASSSIFNADHVGSLFRISMEDLSAIPPWEGSKLLVAVGVNPFGLLRRSNGKVYACATNVAAGALGTYTGTNPPHHSAGTESDGDGNQIVGVASTAGVLWEYLHSLFGVAKITAQAGTTATATVLSYMPVVSPAVSSVWAFGAWSEDQGYPAVAVYFADRLVAANTPGQPQTEWASKTGDYHNFGKSSPLVDNDSITQRLNARQINSIVELIPLDQLISLTTSSSWASPKRGEVWAPTTIGFDPQSYDGSANLRAIITGSAALFATTNRTRLRDLSFDYRGDKFTGDELTVLARHLFGKINTIVDMDYAKEPYGILWIVRSDGALIGLTYLKEQEVIAWHRHDTQGFFERVCVVPEDGRDVAYFVVRRTLGNGTTVRYLERLSDRQAAEDDVLDSFFVDAGLTYDGRNTSSTTLMITPLTGYAGADTVSLLADAPTFTAGDIGDSIQFPSADGSVRVNITAFASPTQVTGVLQSPVPVSLQSVATTTWTFARDTFMGLGHLEGLTVAILADGSPEVPQVVTSGTIVLPYPAGVVHVGLPYVADLETLNVTIFGASESIRDRAKTIPQVSVVVQNTLGLKAGPDANNLSEVGLQSANFDYNAPWPLQSEVEPAYIPTTWNKQGKVLLRQDNPLPVTVLAIFPQVEIGGNG